MKSYPWNPTVYYDHFADFIKGLASFGDKPAVCRFDRQGAERVHSYQELCMDVEALRGAMYAKGLFGQRIAIAGENSYEWLVTFLAVTSGGGVAVCVDIEQTDDTVRQYIRQADAQAVFASEELLPICAPLLQDGSDVRSLYLMAETEKLQKDADGCFVQMLKEGRAIHAPEPALTKDMPAAIVFTSGTTARAKAVSLTHANLLQNAGAAVATVDLGDAIFSALPFYHAYGLNCGVICSLLKGARLTINGSLRTMLRDLEASGATTIIAVPLMVEAMYNAALGKMRRDGRDERAATLLKRARTVKKLGLSYGRSELHSLKTQYFGSVQVIVCGGAHMNPELSRTLWAFGIQVLQGYGITECSPLIAVNRNRLWRFESVGVLLPGYELKLTDGEICVKGPSVMEGYYHDENATAEAVEDGWFKTGDLGSVDANGQIYITGRSKNLIVLKNGKKISPEKIEMLIQNIPLVKEAMVYGVISGTAADDVKPAVSIYPDPERTKGMEHYEILAALQTAVDEINAGLPAYQQLQMIDIREKEFPKTSSHKTKRVVNEESQLITVK